MTEKDQTRVNRKIVRRRGACGSCKARKVRCDGKTPTCSVCEKQGARCLYADIKRRHSSTNDASIESPPSSQCSVPISSTDIVTNVSTNYQFLDAASTVDELEYGLPSYPVSIVDDINLSGVLPLDINLFGDNTNWMNDRIDSQNQRWSRQISLPNSYGEVLSPLESLFPCVDLALKADPAEIVTTQEEKDIYTNESSTLASIVCSNLHDIADNLHQTYVRTLLQEVATKALDATAFPIVSNEDSSASALHQPCYERHVVQEYVDAYFSQFHQRFPFLLKDQFQFSTEALLAGKLPEDNPAVPLINTVLALGCRLVQRRRTNDSRLADQEARHYFAVASRAHGYLAGTQAQASTVAVQALVAMTIYLQAGGLQTATLAQSLITTAVQHCLTLKLNRINSVRALASSEQESQLLLRLFWVVYSLEKPLAMRLGRFSSIDDDLINYSPRMAQPPSEPDTNQSSPFIHLCEHAKLCSMVVKQLYGITKPKILRKDVQDLFHSLDTLLQSWKDQSGPSRTEPTFSAPGRSMMQNSQSENNVELCLRWHELKVTIFHKGKPCVQSAREVLSQAHLLEPSATHSDWLIVQVPIMACCVLLIDVFSKHRSEDFRSNMAFLGMASGWLGRLAAANNRDTVHDIAFNKIMELIALAQQQCKL